MFNSNSIFTPFEIAYKLSKDGSPQIKEGQDQMSLVLYAQAMGNSCTIMYTIPNTNHIINSLIQISFVQTLAIGKQ
jgi:hypothetical protein